jgi:hypothetical protein
MSLQAEIKKVKLTVNTDSYQMSVGEIVSMYKEKELIINPVFQRLFRWDLSQKSRLIESILIGVPLPSIFVYETEDGKWELVDGLQRLSTLLEFMGLLYDADGKRRPPSALEATSYLSGLYNIVWAKDKEVEDVPLREQVELDKSLQLAVRRSRISVEILKRPSDAHTKYDLFQRLNSGGSVANPQELRNCVMVMIDPKFFDRIRRMANIKEFSSLLHLTDDQKENQRDVEYVTRFLVYRYVPYQGRLDVEDYIDKGIVKIAELKILDNEAEKNFVETFQLLKASLGADALKQQTDGQFRGRVGLTALEIVAVGISKNLQSIKSKAAPEKYVKDRVTALWAEDEVKEFSRAGLRGTQRIQKTLPFGSLWFH